MQTLAKEKEVVAYISKPFQVDDLAKVILAVLRKEAEGGTLHNVSPVVFLQLMEMESRTCTIRIIDRDSEKGGVLYFNNGRLYDARVDDVNGIDAAYIIFTWENVTLFIRNECPAILDVINSSLQPIIMKAVGIKDEKMSEIAVEDQKEAGHEIVAGKEDSVAGDLREDSGTSLEDLELPDDVISLEQEEESLLDKVRNLLLTEVGDKCGLQDIYHDSNADPIIESITKLGDMFNFGRFKVGYIDRSIGADEIVIPGEPTVVIKVRPKCPQEKIVNILSGHI